MLRTSTIVGINDSMTGYRGINIIHAHFSCKGRRRMRYLGIPKRENFMNINENELFALLAQGNALRAKFGSLQNELSVHINRNQPCTLIQTAILDNCEKQIANIRDIKKIFLCKRGKPNVSTKTA